MGLYKLEARLVLAREVLVEADSMNEAEQKVKDAVYCNKISFDCDSDYHDTEIEFNKIYPDGNSELQKNWSSYVDDYIAADGDRYKEA